MESSRDGAARASPVATVGPTAAPATSFAEASLGTISALLDDLHRECGELRRRALEIERSNADLEAFASRAAHELRNALAPVRLGCRVLGGAVPADSRAVVDAMERSLHNAVAMLDALLVFSRVGRGGVPGEAGVAPVVSSVLEDLATEIREGDIEVECTGLDEPLTVECEEGLLHIVLTNVVGNAVKFLSQREVRRITIGVTDHAGRAVLSVEDSGPGIPAEAMERIFEPFFRVPHTGVDGHGLGLATVRRILGSCGGRVRVESEVGRGTRVSIELPSAG